MSKRIKITKVIPTVFEAASIQHQAVNYAALCKLPKITPFEYDPAKQLLRVVKPWWNLKKVLVFSTHIGVAISSLFEIILSVIVQHEIDKHALLLRILLVNILCWSFVYHYHIWSDAEGFCSLLNGIIRYNKLEIGNLDTKVMRRILVAMKQGILLTGFAICSLMVACPHTPPFPTSLMEYTPTPWRWHTFVVLIALMAIEVWNVISWICHGAWSTGAASIKKFNKLLVLATYINVQFRNSMHFSNLIAVILLGILCYTATVKYHNEMPSTMMYVVAVVIIDCTVNSLFITIIPGKVNGISKNIIYDWKRQYSGGINNLERKVVRSLREIKIQFGTANYFERGTCLVVMDFQIRNTVDVLLLMS
ncbi:unnamed protein product [Orchesella dallaii]|uniref:Gustatory receptor n=1 Tax=Orchesella dallaii TaxID=48710 RepID=A0ABP1PT25_9HEXA